MIRSSIISLAAAAAVFAPEGLHGNVAVEEQEIASITHLSIEEVDKRLRGIAEVFNVPLEEVTDTFYDDAKAGLLPTAEQEAAAKQDAEDLIEEILGDEGDREDL